MCLQDEELMKESKCDRLNLKLFQLVTYMLINTIKNFNKCNNNGS